MDEEVGQIQARLIDWQEKYFHHKMKSYGTSLKLSRLQLHSPTLYATAMRESFLKIRPVKLHVGYLSNDTMNLYSVSYSLGMLCTILTPLESVMVTLLP